MPDAPLDPAPVVLIDGPTAGRVVTVPEDAVSYVAVLPPDPALFFRPFELRTWLDDTVNYAIHHGVYRDAEGPHGFRFGSIGVGPPSQDALAECGPTGLAETGRLPWTDVRPTALDRAAPVAIEEHGDARKDCTATVSDSPNVREIDASCACGWRTARLPLARRAQLVRTAHFHEVDAPRRRRLLDEPIAVLCPGNGRADDCIGGLEYDEAAGLLYGACRRCGWLTAWVEVFRGEPLRQLCVAHTGPDGVRAAQNRVRAALGAPLLPDPRGFPAYFWQYGARYVAWFCEPDEPERWLEHHSEPHGDHVFADLAAIGTAPEPGVTYTDLGHQHCYAEGCPGSADA